MISILTPLRSLFFFLIVLAFFTTATSVLFHTFGYRFSLERGIFIYTGSITLEANPADIEVSINGEKVTEKGLGVLNNSIHIPGLTPGEYFLEASAPGYHSWTKKVVVESGRSTEFWNVQLTKQAPEWQSLAGTENTWQVVASPQKNIFALMKKNGPEYTIDIFNSDSGKSEQVFSSIVPLAADKETAALWSADGRRLLVPVGFTEQKETAYYFVDTRTKEAVRINQSFPEILPLPAESLHFDPTAESLLLLKSGTHLYRMDIGTPDSAPRLLSENVAAFDISGRTLYFLSSDNGILYSAPLERDALAPIQLTLKPLPVDTNEAYQIRVYDRDRVAILEKSTGKLSVLNTATDEELKELQGSGVRGMQFSDDGKKLLFFTASEIAVYFTRDWEVQPARLADSLVQIGRFSQELGHVQWTKDYEHVLFTLGSSLKVLELDHRDRRNILDIAQLPGTPLQIYSNFADNEIFIVGPEKENASPLIRVLNFPEATGFFSFGR